LYNVLLGKKFHPHDFDFEKIKPLRAFSKVS